MTRAEVLPVAPLAIELPATRAAVEAARLAVGSYLAPSHPSVKALYRVELVIEEVLMNVAWHAYPKPESGVVRVRAELSTSSVVLQFEDEGKPFDPLQAQPRPRPASIEDADPGGLGVVLLRKVASAMSYERDGDTNRLRVAIALD
jgi:anti-sigma regulatory factor (Ser/Thr protein kinase)